MRKAKEHERVCAPTTIAEQWHNINWAKCDVTVRKLQARIVKAIKEGRWNKVKTLQHLLTNSFSGKALAVRKVTENTGSRTPGVDKERWNTPAEKARAIQNLTVKGYKPKPLRRVNIPKGNGNLRTLGIPTMTDRAMQALFLLALDPIAETKADVNSYGFRKGRTAQDAAAKIHMNLSHKGSAKWVLDADIEGCFDNIEHAWLVKNTPMKKTILKGWLKAGCMQSNVLTITESGTPQGGIISPTLANLTLDGLEGYLAKHFGAQGSQKGRKNKVHLVRYADDLIITGSSKELLEKVLTVVGTFLSKRGLKLSKKKTRIVHIHNRL